MTARTALLAALLLAACNRAPSEPIEPAAAPDAQSADRLMAEAARAAQNAEARAKLEPIPANTIQGEK